MAAPTSPDQPQEIPTTQSSQHVKRKMPSAEESTAPAPQGDDNASCFSFSDDDDDDVYEDMDEDEEVPMTAQEREQCEMEELDGSAAAADEGPQVYLPGVTRLQDMVGTDQALSSPSSPITLQADMSTYIALHHLAVEWPCLSFDFIHPLASSASANPATTSQPWTITLVAGSQAVSSKDNCLYCLRATRITSNSSHLDEDGDEMDDDDDEDEQLDPILAVRKVPHFGGINRIRMMPIPKNATSRPIHVAAVWSETGAVSIFDLTGHIKSLEESTAPTNLSSTPLHVIPNHGHTEGYALDWSPHAPSLLTGDTRGRIYLTSMNLTADKGLDGFTTQSKPFLGHKGSVEDIQWSPSQPSVFSSCGVDGTVRIWDTGSTTCKISIQAHSIDVNVISWNRSVDYLLASGCDDGSFSIWDLRTWPSAVSSGKNVEPSASFKWHQKPITSIEWSPTESSVIAVTGADDQLTIWDLALESDDGPELAPPSSTGDKSLDVIVPPQLLFIHQGQKCMKELHWYREVPGMIVSTALDGFNYFKTINS